MKRQLRPIRTGEGSSSNILRPRGWLPPLGSLSCPTNCRDKRTFQPTSSRVSAFSSGVVTVASAALALSKGYASNDGTNHTEFLPLFPASCILFCFYSKYTRLSHQAEQTCCTRTSHSPVRTVCSSSPFDVLIVCGIVFWFMMKSI